MTPETFRKTLEDYDKCRDLVSKYIQYHAKNNPNYKDWKGLDIASWNLRITNDEVCLDEPLFNPDDQGWFIQFPLTDLLGDWEGQVQQVKKQIAAEESAKEDEQTAKDYAEYQRLKAKFESNKV